MGRGDRGRDDELGVRVIVAYKAAKGIAQIAFGIYALARAPALGEELQRWVLALRAHAIEAWSLWLARHLAPLASARKLEVIALAALLDGVLSFVEGWALYRRYAWSRWLVVGATATLLPFEVVALARHRTVGRGIVLLVNVLVVAYFARHRVEAKGS